MRGAAAGALACVCACVSLGGCAGEKAEGRPWVRRVRFSGVNHIDQKDLKRKLAVEETCWLPLSPKRYLDPFTLDADRARIEAYYRAHGWFGARVIDAETRPFKPGAVDVHISVDEGAPTAIQSLTINGLDELGPDGEKLIAQTKQRLKLGATFNHDHYLEAKEHLETRLRKLGHAWALVNGKVEVDRDLRTADVRFDIVPGVVARFGLVHVDGTKVVDPHLIALHAGVRPGDRFDPDQVEEVRGRIYNLGLFSSVKVEYVHIAERDDVADLMVSVREGAFHELRVGGGLGVESLRNEIHASLAWTVRNFRGGLRTLRLAIAPAYVFIPAVWDISRQGPAVTADATLTQPDVPWPRATLKFTLGFDVGIDYAYQYFGPRTQLALQRGFWRDKVLISAAYNFEFLKFFNTDPAIFLDPGQSGRLFGYVDPYRLGWYQQDFTLDLRDRPLDAHKGFYASLSVEEGGPWAGGAFEYEKLQPDVRGYAPLGKRVTFAARFQFGQLFTQGDLGSPTTRRFYLGGPNSHRGFNYARLSLQVPSGIFGVPPIPIGGDQAVLIQGELRVEIFKLFGQWLSLAAFLDAGDVAAPTCAGSNPLGTCQVFFGHLSHSVNFADLYYAVGGGLRYRTIIGTVRFDLGVRLNRLTEREPDGTPNADPGQRFAFHLSVGESF